MEIVDQGIMQVAGSEVMLSEQEFRLAQVFIESRGKVMSRETLLTVAWGLDPEVSPKVVGSTRTVDMTVSRLRKKLSDADVKIQTVRGHGYRMVAR